MAWLLRYFYNKVFLLVKTGSNFLKMNFKNAMVKLIFSFMLMCLVSISLTGVAQSVKMNGNVVKQQPYDLHVVLKGETVYSISKKYSTTVEELLAMNPEIVDYNLSIGESIKVPVAGKETPASGKKTGNAIYYTVQKKETLYAISKRYHTDVETLMRWNELREPAIDEGAKLIVGYETPSFELQGPLQVQVPDSVITPEEEAQTAVKPFEENYPSNLPVEETFPEDLSEKGIATWVKSSDDDTEFYALHPSAPKGTAVQVKNMMNGKTVTVKVIGKLPATSANEHVLIKISGAAAKKLGVLDEKFLVAIYYEGIETNAPETLSPGIK